MLEYQREPNGIDLMWGVKIPMRDGVSLNATVYKPASDAPTPVIFALTPYIGDTYHPRGDYFARHGYTFAVADCRGRGSSEGEFRPHDNQEGRDGHDAIEWLAGQPWCDGQVAMWGGSYLGLDQWMAVKQFPEHLRTIIPLAAAQITVDTPYYYSIFYPYIMQWLTLVGGATPNNLLFAEQSFWIQKFRELYLNHLPFKTLDTLVGHPSPHFQRFLEHPKRDAYLETMTLTPADYRRLDLPILTITGHYDTDQPGALGYYRDHMRHGSIEGRAQHYLVIGPWDHPGIRTFNPEVGGVKFGKNAALHPHQIYVDWYDWILKGGSKPGFLKKRVAYYVMGSEEWKYADDFDSISNETRRLYLASCGTANDVFNSGWLTDEPRPSSPDSFIYDPLDVRPAELENEEIKNFLTDQSYELNTFGNGLLYHTAPFDEATEISGFVKLSLWMEMDVSDTDFAVILSEILPDGTRIRLTWAHMRARFRESPGVEKLVVPGEVTRYNFDSFTFFSRKIAKGSRLRLFVQSINSIFWQKNYNSGGVVAEETAKDARVAHIKAYHDPEHPSCLELPIVLH